MQTITKVFLAISATIVIIVLATVIGIYNIVKTCNENEVQIEAYWQEMQNVNAGLVNKIKSSGKITANYKNSMIEMLDTYMKKYSNDSNLVMKWANEAQTLYPDASMWKDLMKLIESEYTSFQISQKDKIDVVRNYKRYLADPIHSMVASAFGKPSEKAKKIMDMVITTKETQSTFETGIMETVDMGLDSK